MAGPEGATWNSESLTKGAEAIKVLAGAVWEATIRTDGELRGPDPKRFRDEPPPWMHFIADDLAIALSKAGSGAAMAMSNLSDTAKIGWQGLQMMAKKQDAVEDHNLAEAFGDLEKVLDRPQGETS